MMRSVRTVLPPPAAGSARAAFLAGLSPGWWLVEPGCDPPGQHAPECLLAPDCLSDDASDQAAMGLSVTTATAFETDWGPALGQRFASLGIDASPLIGLALHELILNAVVHGNLRVRSGPSNRWSDLDERHAAILAALTDEAAASRAVSLAIGLGAGQIVAVVADEGDGYDPAAASVAQRGSGRGLRIARAAGSLTVRCGGTTTSIAARRSRPEPVAP